MSIWVDEEQKIFHLQSKDTSYIMRVVKGRYLAHVYWGKKIHTPDVENAQLNRWISFGAAPDGSDKSYSLDYIRQEYPTGCQTDYRMPAVQAVFEDGSRAVELVYESYRILPGKPGLQGLPAAYVENEEEADTLEITLSDTLKHMKVILMYTVYKELDVITRSVKIRNESAERIRLEKAVSARVDF